MSFDCDEMNRYTSGWTDKKGVGGEKNWEGTF